MSHRMELPFEFFHFGPRPSFDLKPDIAEYLSSRGMNYDIKIYLDADWEIEFENEDHAMHFRLVMERWK